MFLFEFPLLSLLVWLPVAGGLWVLVAGANSAPAGRGIALLISILTFLASIPLYVGFELGTAQMQFVENVAWIEAFDIRYHLGVDGFKRSSAISSDETGYDDVEVGTSKQNHPV